MNDFTVHFHDSDSHEQVGMGDQTGFDRRQALDFIEKIACGWKDGNRLDVVLLRALCRLTIRLPEQSSRGFHAWTLVETIAEIRERSWSDTGDKARMSDDIRKNWNKLIKTWHSKSEGISQQLLDAGFTHLPALQKIEGGGTGNPTVYRIEWAIIDSNSNSLSTLVQRAKDDPSTVARNHNARYVCEDIEDANPLARIFTRGFQLKGWRRHVYIVMIGAPLLLSWVVLVQIVFAATWASSIGQKNTFTALISLCVVCWSVMVTLGPFYRLATERVVVAPWWMQSLDEDRLIEQRNPPRYLEKSIKAVRYVAECPLCGAKLLARKGPFEFRGRIIGRCEDSPIEHVYSFDHISRIGKLLR